MFMTKEQFAQTLYKSDYETIKSCYCPDCKEENCPHRGAYRRMPQIDGGLGLCPNLKNNSRLLKG